MAGSEPVQKIWVQPGRARTVRLVLAVLLVAVSVGMSNFAASIGLGAAGADARTRLRVAVIFGLFEGGMPALGLLLGRSLAGTLGQAAHWAGAGLLIATGGYGLLQAVRASRAARAVAGRADARAARDQPDKQDQPIAQDRQMPAPRESPARAPLPPPSGKSAESQGKGAAVPESELTPPAPAGRPGRPPRQPLVRLIVTGLALSMDNLVVGFAVGTFPVSLVAAVVTIAAVSVAMSLGGLELGARLGARLGAQTGSRGELIGGLALIGVGIALAAGAP
jgi:putative Mn2+ efflux pump MntP